MNIFGYILITITILMTIFIGIKRPVMHNRVMIYDYQYTLSDRKINPPESRTVKNSEIPTVPSVNSLTQEERVFEKEQNQVSQPQQIVQKETPKKVVQTLKNTIPVEKKQEVKIVKNEIKQTPKIEVKEPPKVVKQLEQKVTTPEVKILTEQEELIAWNKWHSNLQNQLMKDTKLPVLPMGTVFRITFNVDKYGKVSNIQTWSDTPQYTPYAIEYIAPVARSYQGKAILEFPQGSSRTTVKFEGKWKISQNLKYSTPNNYNDVERVVK